MNKKTREQIEIENVAFAVSFNFDVVAEEITKKGSAIVYPFGIDEFVYSVPVIQTPWDGTELSLVTFVKNSFERMLGTRWIVIVDDDNISLCYTTMRAADAVDTAMNTYKYVQNRISGDEHFLPEKFGNGFTETSKQLDRIRTINTVRSAYQNWIMLHETRYAPKYNVPQ